METLITVFQARWSKSRLGNRDWGNKDDPDFPFTLEKLCSLMLSSLLAISLANFLHLILNSRELFLLGLSVYGLWTGSKLCRDISHVSIDVITLLFRITTKSSDNTKESRSSSKLPAIQMPPKFGILLICLAVPVEKQFDRLGDFDEIFNAVWLKRFPPTVAKMIYVWKALLCASAVIRATILASVIDYIVKKVRF